MPELNLVTIVLDKERHMRLTLKGMLLYEKHTGKNLLKGFKPEDFTLEESSVLLWACLVHEDPELTLDAVQEMVDIGSMELVFDAMTRCLIQSLPVAKAGERPLVKKSPTG